MMPDRDQKGLSTTGRTESRSSARNAIFLRGVRVHNLKGIDLDLPLHRLILLVGVSGSGKSSLAFDTLYAEGQRRYIESFSTYARRFLDRLERPDADKIEHIPPAIALRQHSVKTGNKSTVASVTEINDYLRLLFAKIGKIVCPGCGSEIRQETPTTAADAIATFQEGRRIQICFPLSTSTEEEASSAEQQEEVWAQLNDGGFVRVIIRGRTISFRDLKPSDLPMNSAEEAWGVVDRLVTGSASEERLADSLELAFREGNDRCLILEEAQALAESAADSNDQELIDIDGRRWSVHRFDGRLVCEPCRRQFDFPEPRLFSFQTPLGACPTCQGYGAVPSISFDRLVPNPELTLRDGAIVPWTTPAYRHELDELLALADDYDLPVDVPFHSLTERHRSILLEGIPERKFGGLRGFFRWLERHRYKLSIRVFLNRWRTYETCSACQGDRLQPNALAIRVGSLHMGEVSRLSVSAATEFIRQLPTCLSESERRLTSTVLAETESRLNYLQQVGLDYLTLNRSMKTLSGGESRRVALTAALGSSLINTLYVLDEPSAGLHPQDSERVIAAIQRLRDRRNTVVVVEHEESFLSVADHIVEIGPGAGSAGGEIVFEGTLAELLVADDSITGGYLSGRRVVIGERPGQRRSPQGELLLEGARQHNLKNLTVTFPLGVLCVVTGVSGSGKSTLVENTLYPALCRERKQDSGTDSTGAYDRLSGASQIDQVIFVDQQPIGRTSRSNPVTYLKAFDEIRRLFAETPESKRRNYTPAHFSFNVARGGRCPHCSGNGTVEIDMQFLPDMSMTCPECHGTRFQREILDVKYRGLTIAEVLSLTAGEAFGFFRNQPKIQKSLSVLKQIGLDYLPLGQPAPTLSGGESQRLKLAVHLASGSSSRCLFILDEPTTGLHRADVANLLGCFEALLSVGHSLIVVEHQLDVIRAADHVIDLGPGAGDAGGRVIATGTPEEIAQSAGSVTGRYLNRLLALEPSG